MSSEMDRFDLVIEPDQTSASYWAEMWRYRELFWFLAWRDILVRYKQTVIGVAWSVVRPLLTMLVFTVVFGHFAKLPTESGSPYPILVFAALLPWQLFATSLTESSQSLVVNARMFSKIYFPRLIVPISSVMVTLVDFMISIGMLGILMAVYGFSPGWRLLALPLFLLLALMTSLGCGFWFSSLNVKYRDFRYIVPFIVQLGLYISPVGFSSQVVPEKWRLLYSLNPMVGVVDGFRWAILPSGTDLYLPGLVLSAGLSLLILIGGGAYFRRAERTFADVI